MHKAQLALFLSLLDALFNWNAPMGTTVAPFDSALPGTLPILKWECVRLAIKAALALKCSQISQTLIFDRKHYDYWDLPSGYQITQKRLPLATRGSVVIRSSLATVPIRQVHLEQVLKAQAYGTLLTFPSISG
jgi:aspartyl-tRNA(Asn)/glutamyl-tRNA(Gln) amidotransferase subunit B